MNVVIHVQKQIAGERQADVANVRVTAPRVFVVGRQEGCDLRLDSHEVSRRHARVTLGEDSFLVEDLSSNGTGMSTGDVLRRSRGSFFYGTHLSIGPYRVIVENGDALPPPGAYPPSPPQGVPRVAYPALSSQSMAVVPPPPRQTPTGGVRLPSGAVAVAAPDLKTSEEIVALRRRVHSELLKNLDFGKIDPTRPDPSLRPRVLTALKRIVRDLESPLLRHLDVDAFIGEVLEEALGLGPLEPLLADPSVTEIMVVDPATIYVERGGKLELTRTRFTDEERVRAVIERIVTPLGRRIDESQPLVDARLPDGSRVNAIIRPLALRGSCITIRRFPKHRLTADDFVRLGSLTPRIARFLERAVIAKKNVLISGGTGSGKTTLLNVLSAAIPSVERIVTIEDAAELQLHQPHVVSLETKHANMEGKGAFTIRDLVKNALRMRPDRIVVGECRGGEALDMLQAMNTGHDGSLTTIHANSPVEALSRLETLVLMSGVELPSQAIREQIARSIHVIVQQTRLTDGSRKITHVSEIDELDPSGRFEVRPIFEFEQTGVERDGKVIGDFQATGYLPSFLDELIARGLIKPGEPFLAVPAWIDGLQHAGSTGYARVARLAEAGVSIHLQKLLFLAFVFVSISGFVYQSLINPRGLLSRASAGYVAKLNAQQRAMFLPETGAKIAWTQLAIVLALLLLYGFHPLESLPALAALVVLVPPVLVARQVAQRRARIDDQANGFALALGNALKATASIGDALKGATDVTAKPLQQELSTVLRQVGVGSTLEEALLELSARVQSSALDVVVSALLIGRQTGGDLPRILEGTAASLRDLKRLENLTDKVTRSAKQSLGVSATVTAGIAIMLPQMFPGFLDPLRTSLKGQIYSGQMLLVYLGAIYLGYRFTRKSI